MVVVVVVAIAVSRPAHSRDVRLRFVSVLMHVSSRLFWELLDQRADGSRLSLPTVSPVRRRPLDKPRRDKESPGSGCKRNCGRGLS
jgi:hypothetical protein